LHFNSAALVDAAKGYEEQLANGAKMMVTLAGAMSTAEIGKIFCRSVKTKFKLYLVLVQI
jgi:deoxyhypusine synthase